MHLTKKEDTDPTTLQNAQNDLVKVIEENKTLIDSYFIERFKHVFFKYGNIVLGKETTFSIEFNTSNDIEFSIKVENDEEINELTKEKLLCFIFACALAEVYGQKKLIKFVAFDSPFDGLNNTYEKGIYNAIHQLNRIGIQTIITSNEDVIKNEEILSEIDAEYLTDYFSNDDKLMGNF